MAVASSFPFVTSSSALGSSSWIYLLDWILSLILGLAFIFFFNRLVGFAFTCVFKLLLYKRFGVRITVESFKVSLLGGRIFAKNVCIITPNQAISILCLTLTWRYWLIRLSRVPEFYFDENPDERKKKENQSLPSRFLLVLEGLEIFMYNRTMSYDNILNELSKQNDNDGKNKNQTNENEYDTSIDSTETTKDSKEFQKSKKDLPFDKETSSSTEEPKENKIQSSLLLMLKLLPMKVRVKKGALVMGNSTTPSILVASYKSASGIIDLAKSPSALDIARYFYDITFDAFQLSLKPNIAYDKHRYDSEIVERPLKEGHLAHMKKYKHWYKFQRAFDKINRILKRSKNNFGDDEQYSQWQGLRRYVGDQDDSYLLARLNSDEQYAKYSLIVDSVYTRIVYYYDNPGTTPIISTPGSEIVPEHGVEIELSMATIHYGPWADKQRIPLQQAFFPTLSRDSEPTILPSPGSLRQYSGFNITTIVKDEVIFRVPTREPSKDKEILKQTPANQNNISAKVSRPFGWLELKISERSNFSYFTSYIATKDEGWGNKLSASFNEPEIRTSVNHDILFIADSHAIIADVGFPLQWNAKCSWMFDFMSENARIFFLREHAMLFSDIFADFASGEPTPYESFRPFVYRINWNILSYKLYLNVNDANIINNPLDFNSNRYLSFQGDNLNIDLSIPLNGEFSKSTTVAYKLRTSFFDLVLDTPPWHTANTFMKDQKVMGKSHDFTIEGSYTFFNAIEINTSNHIEIRCIGDTMTLQLYGFLVKYLFIIRENYFGDHIHFQTFEEYSSGMNSETTTETNSNKSIKDLESVKTESPTVDYWKIRKTDNDVDLLFTFQVRSGLLVLPCNIYDSTSHIGLSFDYLDVDIRFTNYYMDLQADLSPITGVYVDSVHQNTEALIFDIPKYKELFVRNDANDLAIEGLSIHAHRMFGIPPAEITYFCKWDLECGNIEIDSRGLFLSSLGSGLLNFTFGFKDNENSIGNPVPIVYDALNFSFRCPLATIKLAIMSPTASSQYFVFDLGSILFTFNDIANKRYSSKASISLPSITVLIIDSSQNDKLLGYLKTSLIFNNITQKANMLEHRRLQQEHIKENDAPFHRCPFLLFKERRDNTYKEAHGSIISTLSLPKVNYPLNDDLKLTESRRKSNIFRRQSRNSFSSETFDQSDFNQLPFTLKYNDEDYTPSYEVNPKFNYDNLIFELGEVQSFITPESILPIACLLNESKKLSLDSTMDDLEITIVTQLRMNMLSVFKVDNFRIVSPEISVKLGDFEVSKASDVFTKSSDTPIVNIVFVEPSIAFSVKEEKDAKVFEMHENETTAAIHVKELFFSQSGPSDFTLPISLSINDVEAWFQKSKSGEIVASSNIDDFELELYKEHSVWLVEYFMRIRKSLEPALGEFSRLSRSRQVSFEELVYKISIASVNYSIDHDPGVLTKPANILRSMEENIRFFDGWKVMTRLRHVLQNLPSTWYDRENREFQQCKSTNPSTAFEEVVGIFSRWRGWEANIEQRAQFFNRVFSKSMAPNVDAPNISFQADFSEVMIKLTVTPQIYDFVNLHKASFSWKSFIEEFKDLSKMNFGTIDKLQNWGVIFNLLGYKSKLSTILLGMVEDILDYTSKTERKKSSSKAIEPRKVLNLRISLVSNVENFQQHLLLPYSTLDLNGAGICNSVEFYRLGEFPETVPVSVVSGSKLFDMNLWGEENKIASLRVNDSILVLSSIGDLAKGSKMSSINLAKVSFNVFDLNNSLHGAVSQIAEKDIPFLKQFSKRSDGTVPKTETPNDQQLLQMFGDFSISIRIQEFIWLVEMLHPLRLSGLVIDNSFSIEAIGGVLSLESLIQKIDFNAAFKKTQLMELQNSNTSTSIKFTQVDDFILTSISSSTGYTKLFSPLILESMEIISASSEELKSQLEKWDSLFASKNPSSPDSPSSSKNLLEKLAFRFTLNNDYIRLSTNVDKTKYSLEIESVSVGVHNVASVMRDGVDALNTIVPLYGDLSIPTARVYVVDRRIPVGLSNVLDVNVSVRLLNNSETKEDMSLQVESQYCRICLCPSVLFRIISMLDQLKISASKLTLGKSTKSATDDSLLIDKFSAVHLLSYNFCLGWLFEDSRNDYPGVILGAERFFAITEKGLGKFTLMDAFLSVANGSRSSNFYSTSTEKNNLNRAFLPRMQLIYSIEHENEAKKMKIVINGDELDVKFLSTSVVVVERAVGSGSVVQKFLQKRAGNLKKTKQLAIENEQSKEYFSTIKSAFQTIEFVSTFEGSNVLFYRLNDDNSKTPSSLFLHSPAVKLAAMYEHQPLEKKRHIFKIELLTSSSDNTLYSSCVPVLIDLVEGVKRMMHQPNSEKTPSKPSPTDKGVEFADLMRDVDLHCGIKIESQMLSLSCSPTAKVAAIVGIDGIFIQLNSGYSEVPSLVITALFHSISTSLQHVYSREISGSIGIKTALLTSSIVFGEVSSIFSSGCCSDIEGYINVKQYQDLELFKDIWFPKEYFESYTTSEDCADSTVDETFKSELASNKNISSRFKEVSTTYALPWVVTFIVTNISLKVDFGLSLGNLKLNVDKLWAVSKKSTDWDQDLKMGINTINLLSEGRLGGSFDVSEMNIHTAISWKHESGLTLDVPLILISGGIEKLHLKLSFDYHVFAIANIEGFSMDVFNQKSSLRISKDHLFVTTKLVAAEVYITSLTASNILDIYNAISRMIQENRRSYKETLHDSSRGKSLMRNTAQLNRTASSEILETVKKLETKIQLTVGHLLIHVYPSSFADSKVLVVKLDESKANFQQNEYRSGISNELEIQFNDLKVSLSMTSSIHEDFIGQCSVEEFIDYAHKATGGTIFVFPSFKISMRTFQKYQENVIEYLYQSSFGGTVDLRWNLGSVNFIREMYAIHKKALESRIEYRNLPTEQVQLRQDMFEKQGTKILKQQLNEEDPTEEIDQAINETMEKVSSESKYIYNPLAPPIIEAPQLKELGNATPPLEWFGLHRNKLPNVTHQFGIVSLQKLMHEVELQYSKILGKA